MVQNKAARFYGSRLRCFVAIITRCFSVSLLVSSL